jgi:hypothetical protein
MTFRHDWFLDDVPASQVDPALRNVLNVSEAAGLPPFMSDYMDREGRPVPHGSPAVMPPGRMLPAPPLQMRWYLTEMGILDHAGVNRLRPMTAWYDATVQKPFTV